jgi:hypothetical protein
VHTSIFNLDLTTLHHLMRLHGLSALSSDIRICRKYITEHISSGCCALPQSRNSACKLVSAYSSTPNLVKQCLYNTLSLVPMTDLPTDRLLEVATYLSVTFRTRDKNVRRDVQKKLLKLSTALDHAPFRRIPLCEYFTGFEQLSREELTVRGMSHGILIPSHGCTKEKLRELIVGHLASSTCLVNEASNSPTPDGCAMFLDKWRHDSAVYSRPFDIYTMSRMADSKTGPGLKRLKAYILAAQIPVEVDNSITLRQLRKLLLSHIKQLQKGKKSTYADHAEYLSKLADLSAKWPDTEKCCSQPFKNSCLRNFRDTTSSDRLKFFTCASCSGKHLLTECKTLREDEFDLKLLFRPDAGNIELGRIDSDCWLSSDPRYAPPIVVTDGCPEDLLADPLGVASDSDSGQKKFLFCKHCQSAIQNKKVPALSLANRLYLGPVPEELSDLTIVKESMIARCRAKCFMIKLKEDSSDLDLPVSQRGFKGHVIVYAQEPSPIAKKLPPAMDEITSPVCVLFIGSKPPTQEWLREHAKPLLVRPSKVRRALIWLRDHNHLYRDIEIDEGLLSSIEGSEPFIPPFVIETVPPSHADNLRTSRYDASDSDAFFPNDPHPPSLETPWQNVVISDVDTSAPSNELRAAALRHVNKKGRGYVEIPHGTVPVNEFNNTELFPMIYPTLFPYGIGGFEDKNRNTKLSVQRQVKHFLNLTDRRFQEHPTFMFVVFNMLQRRTMLLQTKLKTEKSNFEWMANQFASVSPETIHSVADKLKSGKRETFTWTNDEKKIADLMQQVNTITSYVDGSAAARVNMWNEIRGLMVDQGLPSFYVTINPADIYNPIIKLLAGYDIDIDCLLPEQVPNYWEQSIMVAKNPAIAAKFFNLYMKAFISCLMAYDPKYKDLNGGLFGICKAYYGCVEAQGRGTLHCHMLIWLHGGLNLNEIKEKILQDPAFKERLLFYLEDLIQNSIPSDPGDSYIPPSARFHPCAVRGINPVDSGQNEDHVKLRQKDMHLLAKQCQAHTHRATCYKYWRPEHGPKECRFDLHPDNVRPESTVNPKTGEIHLRCLDGLVNNFNSTILEAIWCNMDIKFIGSETSAKAILYYITDYITKSQLKTHVAYAALELAINKLEEYNPNETDASLRAKHMLQKCAYALVSHQELSAQQVASYLMDLEDHFTSHTFRPLYWTAFERQIESEWPSPECYEKPTSASTEEYNTTQVPNNSSDEGESADHISPSVELNGEQQSGSRSESTALDDTEICISLDDKGKLHASIDPVTDYRLRGHELDDVCVWDFIARTKKVTKKSVESKLKERFEAGDNEEDNDESSDDEDEGDDNKIPSENIWTSIRRARPKVPFLQEPEMHNQCDTHLIYVNHPDRRCVPVSSGPGLPRRDRAETYLRYCRLMLILFKPWRTVSDLRCSTQSWEEAFNKFITLCPIEYKLKMDNMQALHECRDSRDDHFAQRRNRASRSDRPSQGRGYTHEDDDFVGIDCDSIDVLNHLLEVQDSQSHIKLRSDGEIVQCLEYAERSGMYDAPGVESRSLIEGAETCIELAHNTYEEDCWDQAYEQRRDAFKKHSKPRTDLPNPTSDGHTTQDVGAASASLYSDGSAFRQAQRTFSNLPLEPEYRQDIVGTEMDVDIDVEAVVKKWTLNDEQARAFRIVAKHSLQNKPDQLRMFLSGPGGTGKSRVIDALTDFFSQRGQSKRIRLCTFTGVAACNIKGMTLHSALSLLTQGKEKKKDNDTRTNRDLVTMWEGVEYLIIDEVSMVGCQLMYDISHALSKAKSMNTLPFGGVNVIFAGDFAQLPPVAEMKLYSEFRRSKNKGGTTLSEKNAFGKLLWLSVQTVVILHEIKRQNGEENRPFVELLSRLRRGECTRDDYTTLQSRLMTVNRPDWTDNALRRAPVLVTENAIKDKLNEKGARAFASHTGQELYWYYAKDCRGGRKITDPELNNHLRNLATNTTKYRMGKLPLAIGMPVMISHNFDVGNGVVNGSIGILKKIRYQLDENGDRIAQSCVVHLSDMQGPPLPGLPLNHAAVTVDTQTMNFTHPHSHKRCKIERTQLPIVPAFAMTAHKAQGQTLDKVIVDLASCKGTEAPYVMLSRAKSLDGVHILRPFDFKKISTRPSEESQDEFKRLEILKLRTIVEHGSSTEAQEALRVLMQANIPSEVTMPSLDKADHHHQVLLAQKEALRQVRLYRTLAPEQSMPDAIRSTPRVRNPAAPMAPAAQPSSGLATRSHIG